MHEYIINTLMNVGYNNISYCSDNRVGYPVEGTRCSLYDYYPAFNSYPISASTYSLKSILSTPNHHCPNCGAPRKGNVCEYCGSSILL